MGGRRRNQKQRGRARAKKNADEGKSSSLRRIPQKRQILSIDDLPLEMLTEILKRMDMWTLLRCRLVNKKWLAFSSGILRHRPETEMEFHFQGEEDGFLQFCERGDKVKRLKEFVHCFKGTKNRNCPIARFSFVDVSPEPTIKFFEHDDWIHFLSNFDISTIKCLKLEFIAFDDSPDDAYERDDEEVFNQPLPLYENSLEHVIRKAKELILQQLPNLEEFGLCLPQETAAEESLPEPRIKCKTLPNLKVLHFKDIMFKYYPEISKELLTAAVNLKRVQLHQSAGEDGNQIGPQILTPVAFEFLQSEGKLHLLREADIQLSQKFLFIARKYKNPFPAFKLTFVKISNQLNLNPNQNSLEDAKDFLGSLFESCKVSLRKLSLEPLGVGFSPGLEFSKLENLTELTLKSAGGRSGPFFAVGVRSLNMFEKVRHLDLDFSINCATRFPSEEFIPILPRINTLCVNDTGIKGAHISALALFCPNLTTFKIRRIHWGEPSLNFSEVGPAIWTHMKNLEHLEIAINLDSKEHDSKSLDSAFTGISPDNRQRLYDVEEARRLLKKWKIHFKISESKLKAEREYPSILDMKELKKLTVNPYRVIPLRDNENFFRSNLTWISHEYAFKLMPQLNLSSKDPLVL